MAQRSGCWRADIFPREIERRGMTGPAEPGEDRAQGRAGVGDETLIVKKSDTIGGNERSKMFARHLTAQTPLQEPFVEGGLAPGGPFLHVRPPLGKSGQLTPFIVVPLTVPVGLFSDGVGDVEAIPFQVEESGLREQRQHEGDSEVVGRRLFYEAGTTGEKRFQGEAANQTSAGPVRNRLRAEEKAGVALFRIWGPDVRFREAGGPEKAGFVQIGDFGMSAQTLAKKCRPRTAAPQQEEGGLKRGQGQTKQNRA